jgi:hypothetical protein
MLEISRESIVINAISSFIIELIFEHANSAFAFKRLLVVEK